MTLGTHLSRMTIADLREYADTLYRVLQESAEDEWPELMHAAHGELLRVVQRLHAAKNLDVTRC